MRDYENQVYALREFDDSEKFLVAFSNENLFEILQRRAFMRISAT